MDQKDEDFSHLKTYNLMELKKAEKNLRASVK